MWNLMLTAYVYVAGNNTNVIVRCIVQLCTIFGNQTRWKRCFQNEANSNQKLKLGESREMYGKSGEKYHTKKNDANPEFEYECS